MYLSAVTAVVNRTGDPATLTTEADRIARDYGMRRRDVFADLQRMRRIVCADAIRKAVAS